MSFKTSVLIWFSRFRGTASPPDGVRLSYKTEKHRLWRQSNKWTQDISNRVFRQKHKDIVFQWHDLRRHSNSKFAARNLKLLCLWYKQLVHLSTRWLVYFQECLIQFVKYMVLLSLCYKKRKRYSQEEGFNLKSCFYSLVLVLLWWKSLKILIRRLENYKKK